uniref:Bromo domain-containing protein n=1 Tax=Biomphalaria glabrata TaxID=6526 RepID=A0A2C9JIK7_BIOGL
MGSKKHKKHKSDNRPAIEEEETGQEKPLRLKLNLKVGIGSSQESLPDVIALPLQTEDRKHKHKKKKKKKSSEKDRDQYKYNHEEVQVKRPLDDEDESGDEEEDASMSEHMQRDQDNFNKTGSEDDSEGNVSPSRKLREPRSCTLRDSDGVILKQMLNHLMKILQNKDVNGFFAFPVTDSIAPGYSSIIHQPMDFSTMASKIESNEYSNVMEFKKDFILMCNNAMTYNRPDTIYYKEAKRLLHIGIRQLSKEKLLHLKKTQSFLASITLKELGFDESGHVMESPVQQVSIDNKELVKEEPKPDLEMNKYDSIADDDLSPEEILKQAQDAAKKAKDLLTTRKPKTDLGFLRLDEDGTTSMTILNPWNEGMVSSTQKVISLGDYMGKLKSGSGSLFNFKEDKRNIVCPETYLCYGPFSSHAPAYDSSFASCNKEESDLLLSTYGGDIGVQYAKSVQKFVENAGISAIEMVDKLLDTLTNGQHSKSCILLEQQKRREEEEAEKALQDEMIMKAQKAAEEAEQTSVKDPVQHKLNETAAMLSELSQTQNERLSQDPPPHLSLISPPSDKEADLADKVTSNLMTMTKHVQPSDVVSTKAVRGAMGITTYPVTRSNLNAQEVSSNEEDDSEEDDESADDESMNEDYSEDEREEKQDHGAQAEQTSFDIDST